jgi:hypothetical protein
MFVVRLEKYKRTLQYFYEPKIDFNYFKYELYLLRTKVIEGNHLIKDDPLFIFVIAWIPRGGRHEGPTIQPILQTN